MPDRDGGQGRAPTTWASSGLPRAVGRGQADRARPVPSSNGGLFVGEEDPVRGAPALGDGAQRGRAVEPSVNPASPMTSKTSEHRTAIGTPIRAEQLVSEFYGFGRPFRRGGWRYVHQPTPITRRRGRQGRA